ncbi:RNA-dependent RNA polymerase [Dahlia pinnata mitovirus 1]|uniref:RNA-dependent RNA polymerase n=1 Tax=Dahlia pinnata mitovirus 1 TaxID=2080459 RepID=A0ABM9WIR1_9VIRU|nr:RNA-dependent RNA polymerase [Dahlia pinnata mitovirus 1]DAB41747.1 TPA_inf: RNA-dependent RNA polymerase [Dahlia pinnata mitovirus 1]
MLFKINKILQRRAAQVWRRMLEHPRRLVGLFNKGQLVVFGRLTKGHCLGVLFMSRFMCTLARKSGLLFTAKYLKQAQGLVMWYVGSGSVSPRPKLSMHMKLTRCGLPCMIPSHFRKLIRKGDMKVIRLVLTVLAFHRIMKVGTDGWNRVNHTTIHHPKYKDNAATQEWCKTLLQSAGSMLSAYVPGYKEIPIKFGFSWEPVFTSGPNTYKPPSECNIGSGWRDLWNRMCVRRHGKKGAGMRYSLTQLHTLPVDATALMTLWSPDFLHDISALLYHPREFYPEDGYSKVVEPCKEGVDGFNWLMESLIAVAEKLWWPTMKTRPESGRFGLSLEGAGKVRVFAIPNPIVQRLVKPLHDWEMSILSKIEMDGTYNQLKPLWRLQGKKKLYSFDLKAATDMFPASLSGSMLSGLFGDNLGLTWYLLMNQTAFRSPEKVGSPLRARVYRFTRGQPLGFYSSWPSFALTHHMVVWLAAWRVYPTQKFKDYALLGDDIVIADEGVAKVYKSIMEEMGGVINIDKSLVSHSGCCEFAKKFIVNFHSENWTDCSPVSSACLIMAYSAIAASTFSALGCDFHNSFRLKGAGYRVLARLDRSKPNQVFDRLSKRWRRHWLSTYGPSGLRPLPLKLWLAFPEKGCLTCYEYGFVRAYIVKQMKPRPLDENSVDLVRMFWNGHESTFEHFLSSFVAAHARSLEWYYEALLDSEKSIEDLLRSNPNAPTKLERTSDEKSFDRFGLIFKCWDLLRSKCIPMPLDTFRNLNANPLWIDKPFIFQVIPPSDDGDQNIRI